MKNIIEIKDLSKCYGDLAAVNHISFQVKKGELFAFLGTNGAGKSTTIHMICSLLTKTSGKIIVDGFDMDHEPEKIRNCLGIVFQNNVLDDVLTVKENLMIRAQLRGLHSKELKIRMEAFRQAFRLSDIWNRPFGKLSGGQKAAGADHVVILKKGSIQAEGTPDALKRRYGKDALKLWFDNPEDSAETLRAMGYAPKLKTDHLLISVDNSQEALNILAGIRDLKDFELIKGTMDDVFLAATQMEAEKCGK